MDHEEKYNTARWDAGQVRREGGERPTHSAPVSYTHLTLPTILLV